MNLTLVLIQVTQSHRKYYYLAPSVFSSSLCQPHKNSLQPPLSTPSSPLPQSLSLPPSLLLFSDLYPSLTRILFSFQLCCLPTSADFSLFLFLYTSVIPSVTSLSSFPQRSVSLSFLLSVLYLLLYSFASQHGSFLAFLQCWTLDTETNLQPWTL